MAVRSRSKLLTGLGAMVGLCLAGTGCHTMPFGPDRYAGQAEAAAAPHGTQVTLHKPPADPLPAGTVVSIGRPVASDGTDKGSAAVASS